MNFRGFLAWTPITYFQSVILYYHLNLGTMELQTMIIVYCLCSFFLGTGVSFTDIKEFQGAR